ncbi:MAG TPA: hypothetical protein V6D07_18845 [Trichocoleus sp.]
MCVPVTKGLIKLSELKNEVYHLWDTDDVTSVSQPESFRADLRKRFGDLRKTETWESAYAYYYVEILVQFGIGAEIEGIYRYYLDIEEWDPWRKALRLKVLEAMMANPTCIEIVRNTLEEMFQRKGVERTLESIREFYNLVHEYVGEQGGANRSEFGFSRFALPVAA